MSAEVMSGGGGSPKLQAKTVSPSTSSQNITPDSISLFPQKEADKRAAISCGQNRP